MPQILNVQMTVNNLNLNIPPKLFVLFPMSIAQGRTGVMTARRQVGFGVLGSRRVSPPPPPPNSPQMLQERRAEYRNR